MNKVRYYRELKNMSQEQLESASGVSRVTISDLENEKKDNIKIKTMVAIANALGEKVQDVFFANKVKRAKLKTRFIIRKSRVDHGRQD